MNATHDLIELIAAPENLLAAWRAVRGNIPQYRRRRAAGPDGLTLAEFERDLTAHLSALRDQLLSGRYQPRPPARLEMPKRGGGRRTIGVLTIADRVAQRAAEQILSPLWEPEFLDCSFGFRPGRSTLDAVAAVSAIMNSGAPWVVDGDIAQCFDRLDHGLLVNFIRRRVSDARTVRLVERWLEAGSLSAGPPAADDPTPGWWERISSIARTGFDWTLDTASERLDPLGFYGPAPDYSQDTPTADPELARRTVVRRLVFSALGAGVTFARPALSQLAKAPAVVGKTLRSPTVRRAIQSRPLWAGVLAGSFAVAAAGAYWAKRNYVPAGAGTLQGSPLSPLLANIYLHPFDVALTRRQHALVRYADDWVILAPSRAVAEAAYNDAVKGLARLRLKLNPDKTRLLAPDDPLEFLGVPIRNGGSHRKQE